MDKTIELKLINETLDSRIDIMCQSCGHVWLPNVSTPKRCPRCKNYFGDKHTFIKVKHDRIDKYYHTIK